MESNAKRIRMLVFLKEGEDASYDQLAEIDRLDLRRRNVDVTTYDVSRDDEVARDLRVERAPSILLVKGGEVLKRLGGLTHAPDLQEALSRVEQYRDPFES